ncbi:MAG TPA: peptidoglycan DD-metalloendopeptidase family protein [Gallionellaceae bacterium]
MRLTYWAAMAAVLALAGCADQPSGHRAPIVDHSVTSNGQAAASHGETGRGETGRGEIGKDEPERDGKGTAVQQDEPVTVKPEHGGQLDNDWRPQVYKVQQGDTLYGIAFNFGLDYHDLAEINHIPDPTLIHPGQEIRLFPAAGTEAAAADHGAAVIKDQPLAVKQPYSEQAVAQVEKASAAQAGTGTQQAGETKSVAGAKPGVKPDTKSGGEVVVTAGVAADGTPVKWEMPASGKVIAGFSEADNRKGVDIAGKLGQPIYASAPGKVIFCGSGLRGYGKLVIIKHNATYLSAYAHNDKLLVKEGQMVSKGQMIAQMGNTDADRVALHFEIRKLGKPVDPAKYLVFPKS